jgi:outer membrane protein TolC
MFFLSGTTAHAQYGLYLSLPDIIDTFSIESPAAQIERLNFENEILQFENYKKSFLPSVSFNLSPFNFNRSIVKLQQAEDGLYNYVEDYSGSSSTGLSIQQKVLFTGGTLSVNSNLNYLNELSQKRHSFNTTPFSVNYSQQLFGSGKSLQMEKAIEYKKNEISIKNYCANMSKIQHKALTLYMDAFLNLLEMELSEANQSATDSLLHIAIIKHQNKRITESNLKQIELQAVNNEYLVENARKNYEDAIRALTTYLGLSYNNREIRIEMPEFTMPLYIHVETAEFYIEKNNPKILNSNIKYMEARKDLYVSKLQHKFNANINLGYGMNQVANTFIDAYSDPSRQQTVAISFSIPVSLWGINRNNADIAKNSYRSSILNIEMELDELENEIYEIVNNYNHNVNLWFIAERSYELAQEQYKLVVQEYAMGKTSVYELISSQQEQYAAMQKYYDAIRNVWDSHFKLRDMALYDFDKEMELTEIFLNN